MAINKKVHIIILQGGIKMYQDHYNMYNPYYKNYGLNYRNMDSQIYLYRMKKMMKNFMII